MTRIRLIRRDNAVYVNGWAKGIDLSSLPPNMCTLDYDDYAGAGVVVTDNPKKKIPITAEEYTRKYKRYVDSWHRVRPRTS